MKFITVHFKMFISITISVLIIFVLIYTKDNKNTIESETYNVRRFYIGYCTYFDDVSSFETNKSSKKLFTLLTGEKSIKFKDKNIVFECAVVGRGASIDEKAYYAILYNDGTLKYLKGDIMAHRPITMDATKIYEDINKYYSGKDVDYVYLTAFGNCKIDTVKLSDSQIKQILKKLDIAEQYYPYDDHFHRETGYSFWGYYYNGNYYGVGNDLRSEQYVKDAYDDVYSHVESLIGIKS